MSNIPKPLQPWTVELSLIHPSCWPLLGQLLPKLGNTLFRQAFTERDPQQQPDGFDGVSYRGQLNQLLPTEWGLLEACSDEFYRRLIMGESQYLQPGYQKRQRPQTFYVLLDRGPDQYGAPFLIQFALLLVLAHRARECQQQLQVGFIQSPGKWIVADAHGLEHNIHSHISHARIVPEMISAWQSALAKQTKEKQMSAQTLWVATNPKDAAAIAFGQHLIIDSEPKASDQHTSPTLSVLFKPRQQQLHFHIPESDAALRLLRHPFKTQSALVQAPSAPIELKRFRLHPISRTCFFSAEQTVITIRIPKRLKAATKHLKRHKHTIQHTLVGLWQGKNQTAIVQVDSDAIYCTGFFKQGKITIPLAQLTRTFVSPQTVETAPLAYTARNGEHAVIIIKDGEGQGFALCFEKQAGKASVFVFEEAIALGYIHHERLVEQAFFYTDGHKTLYEINLVYSRKIPRARQYKYPIHALIQRYGKVGDHFTVAFPLMKDEDGHWSQRVQQEYDIEADDKIVGGNHAHLVVQRNDCELWWLRRRFNTTNSQGEEKSISATLIAEAKEPIVQADYHVRSDWVIYQTASRLKVYSLKTDAEIINMELARYAP